MNILGTGREYILAIPTIATEMGVQQTASTLFYQCVFVSILSSAPQILPFFLSLPNTSSNNARVTDRGLPITPKQRYNNR